MVQVAEDFEDEFPGADRLATECYANLVRTGDQLIGLHNRQAWEEHRLSATAKMALAVIEGAGEPLEPSVIAERLLITSGSMTSMLDTLERRGLVRRMPHPEDRRKLLVEVTEEAVGILDEMLPSLHQREKAVIGRALSPDEQRKLLELLARIQASAREAAEDPADHGATRRRPARLARPG